MAVTVARVHRQSPSIQLLAGTFAAAGTHSPGPAMAAQLG